LCVDVWVVEKKQAAGGFLLAAMNPKHTNV
jgi:hypothetical protein